MAVIVVGSFIRLVGLTVDITADPTNSAMRQTVAALWMIEGILGLAIASVGAATGPGIRLPPGAALLMVSATFGAAVLRLFTAAA